ncbi:hypothetical protein Tco_0297360, partial [Tanacetum coccineum]
KKIWRSLKEVIKFIEDISYLRSASGNGEGSSQVTSPGSKSPFAMTNENGDAIPTAIDASKQKNTSSTIVVIGDKTLDRGYGIELALQQDAYKMVKGKRGKRLSISS